MYTYPVINFPRPACMHTLRPSPLQTNPMDHHQVVKKRLLVGRRLARTPAAALLSPPAAFLFFLMICSLSSPATSQHMIFLPSEGRNATARLTTYIVQVRPPPEIFSNSDSDHQEGREVASRWYRSFLPFDPADSGAAEPRLLYTYHHVLTGFAARLTEEELAVMQEKDGFLAAHPDELLPLQTTHSPDFLGLQPTGTGLWPISKFGEGVIVGVLDTGANPNHPSFRCNVPNPPQKWKGRCDFKPTECSNKIIGARTFTLGLAAIEGEDDAAGRSLQQATGPYDTNGHGTHTASTAAGCFVPNASSYGNAKGTAAGMAPSAHLAIYKVCGPTGGCPTSDILAGLDAAVSDGVDVVSLSLGGPSRPFYSDTTAIGTFAAMEKGIFVSCAAGNSGPSPRTVSNEAPWMLTVGASNIDRSIRATVRLGNGLQYDGESLYQPSTFPPTPLPLAYSGICSSFAGIDVRGKVVLCDTGGGIGGVSKSANVKNAGGVAMVLANTVVEGYTITAEAYVLPATHVNFVDGSNIKAYLQATGSPTAAIIFKGTVIGEPVAPAVAYFSSRGPSIATPGIVKPDIIGPGLNILAAWPVPVGVPGATSMFNIISGTSMATPHLSGIAALLKSIHPTWSPAAIKSAMMTTATTFNKRVSRIQDQTGNPASSFAMGSGEVSPIRVTKPGLIYDIPPTSYIGYLCGLKYTDAQVSAITRRTVKCITMRVVAEDQLNYPSFRIFLTAANNFSRTVGRTVTNVGHGNSMCRVIVAAPPGVSVVVSPPVLAFTAVNELKSFAVSFKKTGSGTAAEASGTLTWVCTGFVFAASPLVVSY